MRARDGKVVYGLSGVWWGTVYKALRVGSDGEIINTVGYVNIGMPWLQKVSR